MFRIAPKTLVVLMVSILLAAPLASTALAEEYFEKEDPSGGMMIADAVFVRPIGLAATVIGSVFYVVTLPFSLMGENPGEAGVALVKEPAEYTFSRPLGEFPERDL